MLSDTIIPQNWGSYPDLIQSFCAVIAVPVTLITLIKLVRRDREREKEIDKISNIADMLTNLVAQQKQQNKNANRPIITVNIKVKPMSNDTVIFNFENSNSRSIITSIEFDHDDEDYLMGSSINSNSGVQSFFIEMQYKQRKLIHNFVVIFNTEEGYQYKQEITLFENNTFGATTVFDSEKLSQRLNS